MSGAMDWGVGHYEQVAAQLLPAATTVVEAAAPAEGEALVDLGCGTGNAALIAAGRGARVTGVDPAPRLLEVAATRARAEGLSIEVAEGEAASIPLADGAADVLVSVFGVIFAPDPEAAAVEMARVAAPNGRLAISAWIPEGAIPEASRAGREAVAAVLDTPPAPPPFAWHEADAVGALLGEHGFAVTTTEHSIAFSAESPRAWLEQQVRDHPLNIAGRAVLEPRGEADALLARMLEIYEAGNEDPDAFRVTSRYVIATASR
jgi:SAM-dependent methyltransferase